MENIDDSSGEVMVPPSILKRNAERQERLMRKREEDTCAGSTAEHLDFFNTSFKQKETEIEEALARCDGSPQGDLVEIYKRVSDDLQILNKFLSSSAMFLTPYDLRRCRETVQRLRDAAQISEDRTLPKKKFGFKKRDGIKSEGITTEVDGKVPKTRPERIITREDSLGFTNRKGETLRLSAELTANQDITLSNLEACTVIIHGSPNTVFVNSVSDCTLLLGPVRTSVLLYVCRDSRVVAMCQQMRIHKTERSEFYIHVTTKAIIEDSVDVKFAPYNYWYKGLEQDLELSHLDTKSNNWSAIDDFNWLVLNRQSPNWSLLDESERNSQWPS